MECGYKICQHRLRLVAAVESEVTQVLAVLADLADPEHVVFEEDAVVFENEPAGGTGLVSIIVE